MNFAFILWWLKTKLNCKNCILRILQRDQSVAIIIVSLNFEHFNGVYLCLLHLNSFDIHKIDFALRLLFRKSLE